ncbi:MAG: hypothetical protein GY821_01500 [Gammaproteobacteria bacterium]|nr:hypothetical protein [Gammaproteobacteria bacterium]
MGSVVKQVQITTGHQEQENSGDEDDEMEGEKDEDEKGMELKEGGSQEMRLTTSTQSASQQNVPSSTDANEGWINVPDNEGQSIILGIGEEEEDSLLAIVAMDMVEKEKSKSAELKGDQLDEEEPMEEEGSSKQVDLQKEKEDAQQK